ncbi:hypothetical protein CRG98_024122 [Punica granatum]|uniref:F-box domain-containing protein n=1 Tax=Punica granatum TaxID=22663 RepID=A0A2I0JHW9_PUNGR|nr:hypothetical protein CRG98_024122 [Punica granatum]
MDMAVGKKRKTTRELVDFSELPEGCISDFIALTGPRDACQLSVVCTAFKSAADSDSVWARLLQADVHSMFPRASGAPLQFSSLKQLYFSLCHRPILIDGGKLSFSLNRSSGKKCYMLSARALSITWGDTPMYWTWKSLPDSRFLEVAQLLDVCWLEIRARIDVRMLSPSTLYAANMVFKFNPDSYGFKNLPIEVRVRPVDGEAILERTVYLNQQNGGRRHRILGMQMPLGLRGHDHNLELQEDVPREGSQKEREDGWLEIELGELCNDGRDGEMELSAMQEQLTPCYLRVRQLKGVRQ